MYTTSVIFDCYCWYCCIGLYMVISEWWLIQRLFHFRLFYTTKSDFFSSGTGNIMYYLWKRENKFTHANGPECCETHHVQDACERVLPNWFASRMFTPSVWQMHYQDARGMWKNINWYNRLPCFKLYQYYMCLFII